MPIEDRDYVRGSHPPTCSCAECVRQRLKRMRHDCRQPHPSDPPPFYKTPLRRGARFPDWLKVLLFVAGFSVAGLIASSFVGNFIAFWLLLGFSGFYSVEKWLVYYTSKHKIVGHIYRLLLNLSLQSGWLPYLWTESGEKKVVSQ